MAILRMHAFQPSQVNRRRCRGLFLVNIVLFLYRPAFAQVDEYQLKAAFLYNFAKFVEWPPHSFTSANEPISICILGENPFGDILSRTISGKVVAGRGLEVRMLSPSDPPHGCHILFAAGSQSKKVRQAISNEAGLGILTVGETPEFLTYGGIISFKLDHGNIRLAINVAAAECAQVRISSKLLNLAEIVRRAP